MSEPKRVALAGAGGWGRNIARSLGKLRGAIFFAVCDTDPKALAAVAGASPATRCVSDLEQLLADPAVDALVIATPPETHHRLALEALRRGKDVLVEKPLTLRPQDGQPELAFENDFRARRPKFAKRSGCVSMRENIRNQIGHRDLRDGIISRSRSGPCKRAACITKRNHAPPNAR